MRIEVSHESPISILEASREYNDYDYALVHLFETQPAYYSFFAESLKLGRKVYLDNSIFELKKSFDPSKYLDWICKLKPTYYIVPDVLEDADGTVRQLFKWFAGPNDDVDTSIEQADDMTDGELAYNKQEVEWDSERESRKTSCGSIGVVQGRDWNELVRCYKIMSEMVDIVAISFDYNYYLHTGDGTNDSNTVWTDLVYNEAFNSPVMAEDADPMTCRLCIDKLTRYKTGRQRFIAQLISEGVWNWNKPHHLLGCSLASEFGYYVDTNVHNITSIDTSNPVVAGLQGHKYIDQTGLRGKPKTLLADLIDWRVSDDEVGRYLDIIGYNTNMFKKILKRSV